MTRKHYRQLAAMLANLRVPLSEALGQDVGGAQSENIGYARAMIDLENQLCAILKADNPRFDAARFRDAAQPRNATSTHAIYQDAS